PIMRRIFRDVLAGATLRGIAVQLTREGIPTPQGHPHWGYSTVSALVRNPLYTGAWVALRWHVRKEPGGRKVRERRPAHEHVALPDVPALVTAAEFAQAGAQLARNQREAPRAVETREDALLRAGFAYCGECGAPMRVLRLPTQTVYRCR